MELFNHQKDALQAVGHLNNGQFQSGKDHINYKHGLYKSRLYGIWSNMKTRCFCTTYKLYAYYGARGITVCEEWRNNFKAFYDWSISHGYADNLTIDRIDNNGNYEPNNCRWVDMATQCRNKSSNHFLTYNGKTQTLKDWAGEIGIYRQTLERRLKRGWSVEKALTTPPLNKGGGCFGKSVPSSI